MEWTCHVCDGIGTGLISVTRYLDRSASEMRSAHIVISADFVCDHAPVGPGSRFGKLDGFELLLVAHLVLGPP